MITRQIEPRFPRAEIRALMVDESVVEYRLYAITLRSEYLFVAKFGSLKEAEEQAAHLTAIEERRVAIYQEGKKIEPI